MSKTFTCTCPECGKEITIEAPVAEKKSRGQLAGIALADMTDAQLKIEIVNANSVLYKSVQRGAPQTTIDANTVRVEAAKAEKALRNPVAATADTTDALASLAGEEVPTSTEM